MILNELLEYFKKNEVSIQITFDIGKKPTVHALFQQNGERKMLKTESITSIGALLEMRDEYENLVSQNP